MTDPNMPPERPTEVYVEPTRETTINVQPERSGGGGAMAFIVGGLVVVAIIGAVLYFSGRGPVDAPPSADIDVDISLPDAPKMPEMPTLPPVEPPTAPSPAPAN